MGLSYDDEESLKESVESLRFNPPSDPDSLQGVGSSSIIPPQGRSEDSDICFDNPPSDPNIILEVRRVPVGSSSSAGSTPPQERCEDT